MKTIIIAIAVAMSSAAFASPQSDMVDAGQAVIKANKACADLVIRTGATDKDFCSIRSMAANKVWQAARMKVTVASPATDAISQEVMASTMATLSVVMKKAMK